MGGGGLRGRGKGGGRGTAGNAMDKVGVYKHNWTDRLNPKTAEAEYSDVLHESFDDLLSLLHLLRQGQGMLSAKHLRKYSGPFHRFVVFRIPSTWQTGNTVTR